MKAKSTLSDPEHPCSLAIIEGALCRVNRKGRTVHRLRPVAEAIEQFELLADGCVMVREQPLGFLPGFSNLSCLDDTLRLRWFAELPADDDLYATFAIDEAGVLTAKSLSGRVWVIELSSGRIKNNLKAAQPEAA